MFENILVPLPQFQLPGDYPWRVRFVAAVDDELRRLRTTGHYVPPRFFGYYFRNGRPVGVSGSWTVALEAAPPATQLLDAVDRATQGQFRIAAKTPDADPEFILIHDRHDGACWLWRYECGMKFVEATDPVECGGVGWNDAENRKLLGP